MGIIYFFVGLFGTIKFIDGTISDFEGFMAALRDCIKK